MRGVVTKLLVFVGAFLLATAALALFYAPDKVKRTPLDVDTITRLTGEAQLYDGTSLVNTPVKATSTTHSDSELSTDDVVLFQSSSCLVKDPDGQAPDCVSADDPDNRLVSAGTEVFKKIKDGTKIRLNDGGVYTGDRRLAKGEEQSEAEISDKMIEAKTGLVDHLEAFSGNTIEFIRTESPLLIDGVGVPDIDIDL